MKLKYIIVFLLGLAVSGCDDEQPVFETQFLLPGEWRLTDWYDDVKRDIDNDGNASINLYSQWNGCTKNSIINFRTNNDFSFTSHNNPDNPGCTEINIIDGTITRWQLLDEHTVLLTGENFSKTYEIVLIEDEALVIKGADLLVNTGDTPANYNGGYLRFTRYSVEDSN